MWALTAMGPGLIPGPGTKIPQAHGVAKKILKKKEEEEVIVKLT